VLPSLTWLPETHSALLRHAISDDNPGCSYATGLSITCAQTYKPSPSRECAMSAPYNLNKPIYDLKKVLFAIITMEQH
jgi:hypothetical protein